MDTISIITISFNQAAYLEHAICSVIGQGYDDLEYIVIDPGSTDGSREIIKRYQDRIAKIILEPDSGPAHGLNKGLNLATGQVIGFLNADDLLLPRALYKVTEAFNRYADADVIYGNGYVINNNGRVLRPLIADPFDLQRFAYRCVSFIQPSVFFKRGVIQAVGGFDQHNRTCWDAELLVDIALASRRLVRIDAFLSAFRLHSHSITGSGRLQSQYERDWERVFQKILGRRPRWYDRFLGMQRRLEKWILNPRSLMERMRAKLMHQQNLVEDAGWDCSSFSGK